MRGRGDRKADNCWVSVFPLVLACLVQGGEGANDLVTCSSRSPFTGRFPFLASPLRSRLANASGRIEFIILFMDWSFTSGCSPPRLSATQLPSATDRPVFLSDRDFHPTVGAYSQAHFFYAFGVTRPTSLNLCHRSLFPIRSLGFEIWFSALSATPCPKQKGKSIRPTSRSHRRPAFCVRDRSRA
jgi:hypothetical protein